MKRILMVGALFASLSITSTAGAAEPGCKTMKCNKRVRAHSCKTISCKERIEMKRYRRNPMPYCTWGPESGVGRAPFSMARYRQPNISGGTGGGKFQIIDKTWGAFGGLRYAPHAHWASPVAQERVARRVLYTQGAHAWVNC